jgi:hypothetical protein
MCSSGPCAVPPEDFRHSPMPLSCMTSAASEGCGVASAAIEDDGNSKGLRLPGGVLHLLMISFVNIFPALDPTVLITLLLD